LRNNIIGKVRNDPANDPRKESPMTYRYAWKNNPKRASMYGRTCRVLATGKMGSALIEFENGQKEITSKRALRRKVP